MDLPNTEEPAKPRISRLSLDHYRTGDRRESLLQGGDWDPSNMSYNTLMLDDNFGKIKDYYNEYNESINFLNSEQNIGGMNNSIMGILAPNNGPGYQLDEIHEDVHDENDPMLNDSQKLQNTVKQNKDSFLAELHVNGFDTVSVFNGLSEGDKSQHLDITHWHVAQEVFDQIVDRAFEMACLYKEFPSEYSQNHSNLKLAKLIETQLVIVSPRGSEALKEIEEEDESHQLSLGSAAFQKNKNPFSSDYSVSHARSNGMSFIPQSDNHSDHFYYLSNATFNVQQNSDAGLMLSATGKLNPDSIFRLNDRLDNSFIPDPNSKPHSFQRGPSPHGKNSNANTLNHSTESEAKLNNFEPLILTVNQNYTFYLNTDAVNQRPINPPPVSISHWNKGPLQRKKTKELEEIKSHSDEDLIDETMQLGESGLHNEKVADSPKILQMESDLANYKSNEKIKEDLKSNGKVPIRSRKDNESISFANAKMQVDPDLQGVSESLPYEDEQDSFIEEIDRQIRISNIKILQRTTKLLDDQNKEGQRGEESDPYFDELLKQKEIDGYADSHRLSLDFRDSNSFDNRYEGIMMKFGFKAANEEIIARQMLAFSSGKHLSGKKDAGQEEKPPRVEILTDQISGKNLGPGLSRQEHTFPTETKDSESGHCQQNIARTTSDIQPISIKSLSNELGFEMKIEATETSELSAKKLSNTTDEVIGSDISHSKRKTSIPTNASSKLTNLVQQSDLNTGALDGQKPDNQKSVVRLFKRNRPAQSSNDINEKVETINSVLQNSNLPNAPNSGKPSIDIGHTPKKSLSQQTIRMSPPLTPEPKKSISNIRRSSLHQPEPIRVSQELRPRIRIFKKVPSGFLNRNQDLTNSGTQLLAPTSVNKIPFINQHNVTVQNSGKDFVVLNTQKQLLPNHYSLRLSESNTKANSNGSHKLITPSPIHTANNSIPNINMYPRPPNSSFPAPTVNPNATRATAYVSNHSGLSQLPISKDVQQYSYKTMPNSYWVNYNSSEASLRDSQCSSKQTSFYKDAPVNVNNSSPTKQALFIKQPSILKLDNVILNSAMKKQNENNAFTQNCNPSSRRFSRSPAPPIVRPKLTRNFSIDLTRYPGFGDPSLAKPGLYRVAYQSNNPCIQTSNENPKTDLKRLPANVTSNNQMHPMQYQPKSNKTVEVQKPQMAKPNTGMGYQFESNKLQPGARVVVQGREAVLVRVDKDGKEYYRFADALK
jgi:hypothetical protein